MNKARASSQAAATSPVAGPAVKSAIHGTDTPATIGTAASAGCLRAADADLQVLMAKVPLGTPVFIHA